MEITWKGSPNFTKNRAGHKLKYIIIHWFGVGTLESASTRFQNPAAKASAHYGISKGRVWQWVKEDDASWNAGVYAKTLESIGIEHDAGVNPKHDLADQDYEISGQLVAEICKRWNLPLNRQTVIGHREVKPTQCPGTVNIDRIILIAEKYLNKGDSMVLVKDGQTYYIEGEKGYYGVVDVEALQIFQKLTDKVETRKPIGVQLGLVDSAQAFLIKET